MNTRMLFLAFLPLSLMAQTPGSVMGTVVDDAGKPVVRARIFISRALPPNVARPAGPPVVTGPQVITTMSDRTGTFVSGHLPAGDYVACAQYPGQGLLDACHWAAVAPGFTVVSGKETAGVKITMAKGAVVTIHVNDPHQLLAPKKDGLAGDLRFHVVTAKGHRYEAPIQASDKNGRDHSITVPFGTQVTVHGMSAHLALDDDTGKPEAASGKSVNVANGNAGPKLNYTVTGAK